MEEDLKRWNSLGLDSCACRWAGNCGHISFDLTSQGQGHGC